MHRGNVDKSIPPQLPPPPPKRLFKETIFRGLIETKESKQRTKDWNDQCILER